MFFNSKKKKIYKLLDDLQQTKEGDYQHIINEMLNQKEIALPILIKELKKNNSKYDWNLVGIVLNNMGAFAFDKVLELSLSSKTEINKRAHWTIARFGDTAIEEVVEQLNHPSAEVRTSMAEALEIAEDIPQTAIEKLIPLLADEDNAVRKKTLSAIETLGEAVAQPLLDARADNTNNKLRKGALVALLSTFPNKVSKFDENLIKRLDSITAKTDLPQPFVDNSWLVLPKSSIENVMEWCGLHEPIIVPFRKGLDAVQGDFEYTKNDIEKPTQTRVFITPVINDKWVFVIGDWWHVFQGEAQERINFILEKISKDKGEAYCFTNQTKKNCYAWTIAINGVITRQHLGDKAIIDEGEATPPEQRIRAYKVKNDEEINDDFLQDWLPVIANYYCLYPGALNENTSFSDVGYLAKTDYGIKHGMPKRALAYWWK